MYEAKESEAVVTPPAKAVAKKVKAKKKENRKTWYRSVDGKIERARRVACPEGFFATKEEATAATEVTAAE